MDTRNQHLLLKTIAAVFCLTLLPITADAQEQSDDERGLDQIVLPDLERRTIKESDIDSENFEIGGFAGFMNVEDFGTNPVYGIRAAYHATEDFFLEATLGTTELGTTSFEDLSGNVQILPDDQRDLTYYNLSVGYNLFPGEVFLGKGRAFNTNLYLIAGAGNTDFADSSHFTYNLGVGYRFYATDWLSAHLDMRNHVFNSDLLGEDKTLNNLEFTLGFTAFF
ncbi:outer membrane beta-barrel domain-containing protein [bacterium SCSIO 12696]|nr:outer membrane beta-barrel domain-containing protein [bacterium SCSIO 12696]